MALYIIHRIHREELPAVVEFSIPAMTAIKFFPIRSDRDKEPYLLDAEDPTSAFSLAAQQFPTLRSSLAVQPLTEYQNDLAKFAALAIQPRDKSGRFFPRSSASRPGH
jgi:hypothetical protein